MKRIMLRITTMLLMMTILFSVLPRNMWADNGLLDTDDLPQGEFVGLNLYPQKDSIRVTADYCQGSGWAGRTPYYCMYAYNQQTAQWSLVGGWQKNNVFNWEPDANDKYTIVVYITYENRAHEFFDHPLDSCWQEVSRPQMGAQITGDCAMPTADGLLYGCTSNIQPQDSDYFTTCYIWSHDRQAWITQASYRAWGCAWYRTAVLPKGLYMMYNCTEKQMPDGNKRKLSCHYYLFTL